MPVNNKIIYELLLIIKEELSLFRKEQKELKQIIELLKPKAHPVSLSLTFKINKMKTFKIGDLLEGSLELDDNVTGLVVADAKFSGDEVTSSDETVATVVVNPDDSSKVDVTAVAEGTFTVHVKATADYTDSNGDAATSTLEADSNELTVSKAADGVTLKVNFS